MAGDEAVLEGVRARAVEPGRVAVTGEGTPPLEILVPAGVGVPGADEVEFVAALVVVLGRRGVTLPETLDASAAIGADPGLLSAVAELLEQWWEDEG